MVHPHPRVGCLCVAMSCKILDAYNVQYSHIWFVGFFHDFIVVSCLGTPPPRRIVKSYPAKRESASAQSFIHRETVDSVDLIYTYNMCMYIYIYQQIIYNYISMVNYDVVSVLCGSNLGTSGTLIFSEKIWSHLKPVAKIQVDPFLKSGWIVDWTYPLMWIKQ